MLNVPTLAVYDGTVMRFLKAEEIMYCLAEGAYTSIYLSSKERLMISKNLKAISEQLPQTYFVRVHQSCVVNLYHVLHYQNGNVSVVRMSNQEEISVSRNRKAVFLNRFKKL